MKYRGYNYLFVFSKECDGYNKYWTSRGNYMANSIRYRSPEHRKDYGAEDLEELTVIECEDQLEAIYLQRAMNEIFKPWQNGGGSVIKIDMKPETFIDCLKLIHKIMNDNNKMLELFKLVVSKFKHNSCNGIVYFVKCANNKLKIGETGSLDYRWEGLKKEEQNQAIDIIAAVSVDDRKFVEAELQLLCRDYKTDGNKVRRDDDASKNLSELFINCEEVINIWDNYWESYKGFNFKKPERYLNYLRTGKWPE